MRLQTIVMVTLDTIRELALALPEVTEGSSYGTTGFRLKDKFLGRLRPEGDVFVLRMNIDQRDILATSQPEKFYFTDHYKDYPAVLIRMEAIEREEMQDLLAEAWFFVAPKRVAEKFGPTIGRQG